MRRESPEGYISLLAVMELTRAEAWKYKETRTYFQQPNSDVNVYSYVEEKFSPELKKWFQAKGITIIIDERFY